MFGKMTISLRFISTLGLLISGIALSTHSRCYAQVGYPYCYCAFLEDSSFPITASCVSNRQVYNKDTCYSDCVGLAPWYSASVNENPSTFVGYDQTITSQNCNNWANAYNAAHQTVRPKKRPQGHQRKK
jgi:hypothetical protein